MAMQLPMRALLALAVLASTCHGWRVSLDNADDLGDTPVAPLIHLLRPLVGSGGRLFDGDQGVHCDSWRVGVEAHNVRDWKTVPLDCKNYIGHYMLGKHYRRDNRMVIDQAVAYAEKLKLSGNGTEVWVFDIDETSLSNIPYYHRHRFGVEPYNQTAFTEWVLTGEAPALPETARLYKKLLLLGIKIVFLTGRKESQRNITVKNLIEVGYCNWEKLILKPEGLRSATIDYKSGERKKLEESGLVIVGNIGDQWSDILGESPGQRTFKLPDPMYYIG